jgi:hypothetical protein
MQFFLNKLSSCVRTSRYALVALSLASASHAAWAESAYIQQAGGSGSSGFIAYQYVNAPNGSPHSNGQGATIPVPELLAPRSSGGNLAASVTVGSYNKIAQIQAGQNDTSMVSILGGTRDSVGVLQAGNSLTSNVVLLGVQGVNLDLVQRSSSAPIDLLIAKLPNGSYLIRR